MSFMESVGRFLLGPAGDMPESPLLTVKARSSASEYPSFEDQMAVIQHRGRGLYRGASVSEALGVPSIFAAVSLIANTVGSLSMEAYRKGVLLNQEETPRLVQRPNPFSSPRDFFRDTAFHLATRGEAWWWIAKRDIDNSPLSLYPVPPWEIVVEQNDRNRLRPTIKWADRTIPNDDIRQITYLPGRDGRGSGPLQECGAAVSIAVEALDWAANFFSGSIPSMIGTTEQDMTPGELTLMDEQWLEKPNNVPRWMTNGLTMAEPPFNPEKAQLNQARMENNGDTARMFNMPGALLEYSRQGASLTYQNLNMLWTDFARRCLSPNYLEPMEQEMSDLLTRSTVGRFNLKQLTRADPKTRMEVHAIAVPLGIYDAETAAQEEGYAPGNVDFAPVPFAPPQALPTLLPPNRELAATAGRSALSELHCPKCGKLVGRVSGGAEIMCPRCRSIVGFDDPRVDVQARTMLDVLHDVVTREPPPPTPVIINNHQPPVTFEEGAFQAPDMSPMTEMATAIAELAARPAPANEITVQPTEVHIDEGAIRVETPPVNVEVHPTPVTVESPNVTVNMPEPRPMKREVKRDKSNNIISINEVPA